MTAWALLPITLATLYVGWQLMGLTFAALEGRCTCRKGAWDPRCVVHGREVSRRKGEDMQTNKESEQSVSQ